MAKAKIGRPPKILQEITEQYTDARTKEVKSRQIKIVDAVIRAIEAGASVELAAESVGIDRTTIYNWISRGEEWADPPVYQSGKKKGQPKPIPEEQAIYVDFLDRFTRARAAGRIWHIANIRRHAEDDWRASGFFLERSDPENWGRRDKTHVSGNLGFTPASVDLSQLSDKEAEQLERLLAKAQEDEA
jgi:hypothetical protein